MTVTLQGLSWDYGGEAYYYRAGIMKGKPLSSTSASTVPHIQECMLQGCKVSNKAN